MNDEQIKAVCEEYDHAQVELYGLGLRDSNGLTPIERVNASVARFRAQVRFQKAERAYNDLIKELADKE